MLEDFKLKFKKPEMTTEKLSVLIFTKFYFIGDEYL